ncbi:uncharacterized protein LOC129987612 [Argiope bruennichi]|uniref:uncharacterized protein LOC129987612 n=1 Tax=Argiope bruennichi TaxID=94029 RepID=UPI002495A566|nr:uncharacterized protein LOC129987612 [Argiope bruennichi]
MAPPPKKGPFSGHRKVQLQSVEKPFDHFFVVQRVSDTKENFHNVSPFLVEKAFVATIGDVSSIRKLRSGDLLVEVSSRQQAQKILKLKALATIPITVSAHKSLNSSKGVITCGELYNVPIEIITKELSGQGVTQVRQITIRRNGELLNTKHYILTFNSPKLPESIKAGYINLPVRPYIPNPLRCFQCQRFGHAKSSCRGTLTCARCSEKGHDSQQCAESEKCINCSGDHTAYSRLCPQARRKVTSQTPNPSNSYASVFAKNFKAVTIPETHSEKTKQSKKAQSSSADSDSVSNSAPESSNTRRRKGKTKSQKSLSLRLSKRGLSQADLPTKLKKSTLKNSIALGLANRGLVQQDLPSIFGNSPKSSELISLHPSEEEDDLKMSCDTPATPHSSAFSSLSKTS